MNSISKFSSEHLSDTTKKGLLIKRELTLLRYAIQGWLSPDPEPDNSTTFTCYRESGWSGILTGLIVLTFFESIAVHFYLKEWSSWFTHLHTFLMVYGVLWILGDFQAIKKNLTVLNSDEVRVRVGTRWDVAIPFVKILEALPGEPRELESLEIKMGEFATEKKVPGYIPVSVMGKANVHLILKEPIRIKGWFGSKHVATRIGLTIDESEQFLKAIRMMLKPS